MADKRVSNLQPSTSFHFAQGATSSPSTPHLHHTDSKPLDSAHPYTYINSNMSGTQQPGMMVPKQSNVHSLMSPPEATPYDSFAQGPSPQTMKNHHIHAPLSPPVSPAVQNVTPEQRPNLQAADPILFPSPEVRETSQAPLFAPEEALETERAVDEHIQFVRKSGVFRQVSPPLKEHYQLALEFKSTVMSQFAANRGKWLARERALLLADRERQMQSGRRYTHIAPAYGKLGTRAAQKPTTGPTKSGIFKRIPRPPQPKGMTPDPNKPKAERPAPREDRDFESIPDYCPPTSSLPSKPNSLKVDWKGAPIDLQADPHFDKLHAHEILLAENLRLDCATYLTSKRRIFVSRLEKLRKGKEFRKTDAQQACKIDVNKASKLWQAFDKVGWLQAHWVEQYL